MFRQCANMMKNISVSDIVLVCQDRHNRALTGWLKQQRSVFSQFWGREGPDQDVIWWVSSEASWFIDGLFPVSSQGFRSAVSVS